MRVIEYTKQKILIFIQDVDEEKAKKIFDKIEGILEIGDVFSDSIPYGKIIPISKLFFNEKVNKLLNININEKICKFIEKNDFNIYIGKGTTIPYLNINIEESKKLKTFTTDNFKFFKLKKNTDWKWFKNEIQLRNHILNSKKNEKLAKELGITLEELFS